MCDDIEDFTTSMPILDSISSIDGYPIVLVKSSTFDASLKSIYHIRSVKINLAHQMRIKCRVYGKQ